MKWKKHEKMEWVGMCWRGDVGHERREAEKRGVRGRGEEEGVRVYKEVGERKIFASRHLFKDMQRKN